jgi:hypothetical protein
LVPVAIRGSDVTALTCDSHGTWFDAGDVGRMCFSRRPAPVLVAEPPPPHDTVPRSLVVIAWLWIVGGLLQTLGSFLGLVVSCATGRDEIERELPYGARAALENARLVNGLLQVALLATAIYGVLCGFGLLARRERARRALVVLTSLLLLYLVGFFLLWTWTSLGALDHGEPLPPVAGVLGFLALGGPTWLMLRALRGKEIRYATIGRR